MRLARMKSAIKDAVIRSRITGFVTPRANERLTGPEFQRAREICREVRALVSGRADYVRAQGLDAEVWTPGGIWAGEWQSTPLYRGTVALLREEYEVIDNLRLFSQVYTGYSLIEMKGARGLDVPDRVPPDLEARLAPIGRRIDDGVRRYWVLSRFVPRFLRVSQPRRFGEVGWIYAGKLVNHDASVHVERIALLHGAGLLEPLRAGGRIPLILEIGGGFGGLAFHLKGLLPRARYVIVDLPESLAFSAVYLSTLFPDQRNVVVTSPGMIGRDLAEPGFTFVPNHFCHRVAESGLRADLAMNMLSLSEMTEKQVTAYCRLLVQCLAPGGAFFEQNQDNRPLGRPDIDAVIARHFPSRREVSFPVELVGGRPNVWRL